MEAHEFIVGHEQVIAHFGLWPSFHDAEVFRLALDRAPQTTSRSLSPVLDLHLRGWVMTSEITDEGFYRVHGDALFHLRFEGISDLQLEGFNNQNVLSALNLELIEDPRVKGHKALRVELEHCYEFQASFNAQRACVMGIVPYSRESTVAA